MLIYSAGSFKESLARELYPNDREYNLKNSWRQKRHRNAYYFSNLTLTST